MTERRYRSKWGINKNGGIIVKLKRTISLICIAVLIMAIFSGCGTDTSMLALNLKKGDIYKAELTYNQTITETIMGKKMEVGKDAIYNYEYNIQDVDSHGVYTIKVTYKNMNVKTTSNGVTNEYDSAKINSSDPSSRCIGAVTGQSFIMKIDRYGNVKSIEGVDKIIDKVMNGCNLDEKTKASVKELFKQILNEDVLKQQFEETMEVYPTKKIKKGDMWTDSITISKGIPMKISTKMILKDVEDGVATIYEHSTIKAEDNGEGLTVNGIRFKYSLTGDQCGNINIKTDNGLILDSKIELGFEGKMTAEGKAGSGISAQEIPIEVEGSYSMKMSK